MINVKKWNPNEPTPIDYEHFGAKDPIEKQSLSFLPFYPVICRNCKNQFVMTVVKNHAKQACPKCNAIVI